MRILSIYFCLFISFNALGNELDYREHESFNFKGIVIPVFTTYAGQDLDILELERELACAYNEESETFTFYRLLSRPDLSMYDIKNILYTRQDVREVDEIRFEKLNIPAKEIIEKLDIAYHGYRLVYDHARLKSELVALKSGDAK